jgi:hypothetical protein
MGFDNVGVTLHGVYEKESTCVNYSVGRLLET